MIDLGRQYTQRLRAWQEELDRQLSSAFAEVSFAGFTTLDALTPDAAEQGSFTAYPEGKAWGACWEYGWFRADVTIPEGCENRRVVFFSGLGGEQLVYVNGMAAGAIDREHPYVTLTRSAKAGDRYHLLIESYAGHGPRLESIGLCPPERQAVPPAPETQCRIAPSSLAVWNEEAYQLKLDLFTLTELLKTLPDASLRALKVAEALDRLTHEVDLELPADKRAEEYRKGREILRDVLACHNGSTAPEMRLIGQSHIDLAWLWPLEETYHKACRTYATQLALMEEYPEYHWLLVEPALLDMLRARDPALWERVKKAAAEKQIQPEGAFYVECDTNIPSGESLIRQLIAGKKWFRQHFGVDSQVAWLPDCFGFSAVLPQLFCKLGIRYFATQKLLRADPECERFPYQHFIWEGLDGSETESLSFMRDNGPVSPYTFYRRWELERTQKTDISVMLHPFGYGDGGGGPTRDMVELSMRLKDLEGTARSRYSGLREYFEEVTRKPSANRWVGELYLSWHRGTWTSQRRNKALIRKAEEALREAELLDAIAPGNHSFAQKTIKDSWQKLFLQQFHDVAGGVGITRVHDESTAALTQMIACLRKTEEQLCSSRNTKKDMVFNPLSWARTEPVRNNVGEWEWLQVPASGVYPSVRVDPPTDLSVTELPDCIQIANRFLSLRLDPCGRIIALTDLENQIPLLNPGQIMNDWRLYQNVQTVYDGWELDRDWPTREIHDAIAGSVALHTVTPQIAEVRIERRFGNSSSIQLLRMYASSRRIDFETEVDWHERHRMLKAHFESNIHCENATHEIQFGCIERPAHRGSAFASDRYEVCQQRWSALHEANRGFALLNDGIFGLSAQRGELALTLLRAPLVPSETNNQGKHHFTYALYPFASSLSRSHVVQAGYALNQPLRHVSGSDEISGPILESDTLILETVKRTEDGSGLALRVYQSMNETGRGVLRLGYPAELTEISMDEEKTISDPLRGSEFILTARPFEIKTFRAVPLSRLEEISK